MREMGKNMVYVCVCRTYLVNNFMVVFIIMAACEVGWQEPPEVCMFSVFGLHSDES